MPETATDWLVFAWMTIVLVAFGVYLWNFGVKRTGVVVASLYLNLVPVVSISIFAYRRHASRPSCRSSAACWSSPVS